MVFYTVILIFLLRHNGLDIVKKENIERMRLRLLDKYITSLLLLESHAFRILTHIYI